MNNMNWIAIGTIMLIGNIIWLAWAYKDMKRIFREKHSKIQGIFLLILDEGFFGIRTTVPFVSLITSVCLIFYGLK